MTANSTPVQGATAGLFGFGLLGFQTVPVEQYGLFGFPQGIPLAEGLSLTGTTGYSKLSPNPARKADPPECQSRTLLPLQEMVAGGCTGFTGHLVGLGGGGINVHHSQTSPSMLRRYSQGSCMFPLTSLRILCVAAQCLTTSLDLFTNCQPFLMALTQNGGKPFSPSRCPLFPAILPFPAICSPIDE